MNQWFRRRFLLLVLCEVAVLIAIALVVQTKHLPSRAVGIIGLMNFAAMFVGVFFLGVKARVKVRAEEASLNPTALGQLQSQKIQRAIKAYKWGMILFAVALMGSITRHPTGLVNANSEPRVKAISATFDLCVIAVLYLSMRRSQTKLKKLGEPS